MGMFAGGRLQTIGSCTWVLFQHVCFHMGLIPYLMQRSMPKSDSVCGTKYFTHTLRAVCLDVFLRVKELKGNKSVINGYCIICASHGVGEGGPMANILLPREHSP